MPETTIQDYTLKVILRKYFKSDALDCVQLSPSEVPSEQIPFIIVAKIN